MTIEAVITLALIVIVLILLVKEVLPVDLVAMGIIVVLVTTGVITVEEGLSGFANEATLTVAAMFVLSHALIKSQILDFVSPLITKLLERGYRTSILSMGLFVGGVSAFINNTPIVATFIPIVNTASRKTGLSPSRYLIPLSFAAIFGGSCTLIGTSTNLIVSGMASDRGVESFTMFTLAPLGLILFACGILYLILFGKKLIPQRSSSDELKEQEEADNFMAEIQLKSKGEKENKKLGETFLSDKIEVIRLKRGEEIIKHPTELEELRKGDNLLIKGSLRKMRELVQNDYFEFTESFSSKQFPEEETCMVELVLFPNSDLIGSKLKNLDFLQHYKASVIAIRQRGKKQYNNLENVKFQSGDVIVLLTNEDGYKLLYETQKQQNAPFLFLRERRFETVNKKQLISVIATIASVVILASTGVLPLVISAFAGIIFLFFIKVIDMNDVYRSIDWKVILLLAGSLSLGEAMSASGLSDQIGNLILTSMNSYQSATLTVAIFYITTSLLTETMSNNASAALMVPIAFSVSESLEVNTLPLLLTIAFAGSSSFMTPIGYQTNTMIYSAGNYKFSDFTKVGAPLNLIFWILASILIPLLYPF